MFSKVVAAAQVACLVVCLFVCLLGWVVGVLEYWLMLHESVGVEQKLSTGVLLCMLVCAVNAANLCYYLILLTCVCVCASCLKPVAGSSRDTSSKSSLVLGLWGKQHGFQELTTPFAQCPCPGVPRDMPSSSGFSISQLGTYRQKEICPQNNIIESLSNPVLHTYTDIESQTRLKNPLVPGASQCFDQEHGSGAASEMLAHVILLPQYALTYMLVHYCCCYCCCFC